ncbi:MAG: phage tail tape measure protein [Clostridium sp.]|nr:phage tail tape measure protein [Clostridium sp.]
MARDSNTVVAKIGLDDSGFQEGVSKIQRSLKVVQSEFSAASLKLGDFGKSTEGLRLKQDTLNKKMELQKQKVAALSKSYEESALKKGEDAKATENLKIKLNYATAELNKMESELKNVTTELNTKSSTWYKLSESMDKAGEKMKAVGGKMSSVGKTLSAAVTLPIVGIGTAATKMAIDAVESENLFEVAMGNMAGEARKWSEETSKALGLNAYNVRKNVSTYNSMLTSMGLTSNESLKMSQGLTQLSYDMASFYNLQPEEAFEKLKAGISGESEPLKALGILVNDATIKNYAYVNGIAKQGEALTEAQKVQARYGVILEGTKNAHGDLERTMDSPTNKIRVMKEQVQQLAIQFGQILIPILEKVISVIKPLLDKFMELSKEQQQMIVTIGLIAAAVGPLILIIGKVITIVGSLSSMFSTASAAMATAGGASTVLGTVFTVLTGPVAITIAAITGLIAIFISLYKNNEELRNVVNKAWNEVKTIISGIIEGLKLLFQIFIEFAKQIWSKYGEDIINIVSTAFTMISTIVKNVLEVIKNTINVAINILKGNWQGAWESIKVLTSSVWNNIKNIISTTLDLLKGIISVAINMISSTISGVWNNIKSVTTAVWNGIKTAITTPINSARDAVKNAIDSIFGFFRNLRLPEIKIPRIKLPHFSLSGEFSLLPPRVPSLSVDWYAKGGIFNAPSIIGVGEAGTEAVLPIDRLDDLMANALQKVSVNNNREPGLTLHIERFINNSEKDIEQLAYELEFYRQRISKGRGGM